MPKPRKRGKKIDLVRENLKYFTAKRQPEIVTFGRMTYLAIDGRGSPRSRAFQEAVGALYGVGFTVKMRKKFEEGIDYKVCPLEGLWWAAMPESRVRKLGGFHRVPTAKWRWRLLILTPHFIRKPDLQAAAETLAQRAQRKKTKAAEAQARAARRVQLARIREGKAVQVLHVGSYSKEASTIRTMRTFAERQGLTLCGVHHEIYLGDPRKARPERLRTILRRPVR